MYTGRWAERSTGKTTCDFIKEIKEGTTTKKERKKVCVNTKRVRQLLNEESILDREEKVHTRRR